MSNLDKAAEALEKTADGFASGTVRWHQGSLTGPDDSVCLMGSIYRFISKDNRQYSTRSIALKAVETYTTAHIGSWNDQEGRTVDEVIEVARLAAKDIRNGEVPDRPPCNCGLCVPPVSQGPTLQAWLAEA